jgi:hypothetical protein
MKRKAKRYTWYWDCDAIWICSVHGEVDAVWLPCWNGCEDGFFDAYEDDPINCDDGELETCSECKGRGGWQVCAACNINNPDVEF